MKDLSNKLKTILIFIQEKQIQSVSFDIDGTLYPMLRVEWRWWKLFFLSPLKALKFIQIRKKWERRRKGTDQVIILPEDVSFFERFLLTLLYPALVPNEIKTFLHTLKENKITIYFLSDHGTGTKLKALNLTNLGTPVNCLDEVQELKPHKKIAYLLTEKYHINPLHHLHLGDRWTDEEQAQLLKAHFQYLAP